MIWNSQEEYKDDSERERRLSHDGLLKAKLLPLNVKKGTIRWRLGEPTCHCGISYRIVSVHL